MMPGIMPNGLFWTMQIPRDSFVTYGGGQEARLVLRNLPLVETFQVFGPLAIPGQVDMDVRWQATGDFVERGEGKEADGCRNGDEVRHPDRFIDGPAEARTISLDRKPRECRKDRGRHGDADEGQRKLHDPRSVVQI